MDKQRQQAYYQLIESLLSCSSGEAVTGILQENQELLNAGFLQTLEAVAEDFAQQGRENVSNWLKNLANQLRKSLNLPRATPDLDTYEQFLLEVLQATADSNGNLQVVYPLLEANTDKLNDTFVEILRRFWAKNRPNKAETIKFVASDISNFSNLIQQFSLGDKASNMEFAISGHDIALTVFTRADFPQQWAAIQHNLGNAYSDRIKGNKAENLELAIITYLEALQIRTRVDFPQDWAMTQNNLGTAYRKRIKGNKAENLELAIITYLEALQIRTRVDFPQDWVITQNNLGIAYSDRIKGDKAENLELAIAAYLEALQIYTSADFPQDWAWGMTQNNLGTAYRKRIKGDKAENLELAIAAYLEALQIYTSADFPQDWAWGMTQNNLGTAYRERIWGDKAENLELAIAAFSAALEIHTRADFPHDNVRILYNLALAYQDRPNQERQHLELAYTSLAEAIAGIESLREEIISGDETKRKQAEQWNETYINIVEVCLELGNFTTAIEYVERSKTRNLVESILNRDIKTIFPSEVVIKLEQLRDEIASGQYQIQNGKAENPKALAQHLQQLRQQRNELQDRYLPVGSSFKFDSLQSTLDANTAIIEWYLTSEKIIAFMIKPQKQEITVCQSQPKDIEKLMDLIDEYLRNYSQHKKELSESTTLKTTKWQNQLEERLQTLSNILNLEGILTHIPENCDKLILIPHRFLHLFPLHALPVRESYLLDLFPRGVGYAPSCQTLQQVQLRQRPNFQSLFAIQTPTKDLYGQDLGAVTAIKKQFTNSCILKEAQAEKSAVFQNENLFKADCLFFFCHGYFDFNSPLDSGLNLADENLTLADIITKFQLENCRLVTLAACETGFTDFTNTSDEYIGLPNGFLLAGSNNVVSSLWTVDKIATALLMIKFYEELRQESNIVVALTKAQHWLRETTAKGFQDWLETSDLSSSWRSVIKNEFRKQNANNKPFASPFYWSAFCAIGKGE